LLRSKQNELLEAGLETFSNLDAPEEVLSMLFEEYFCHFAKVPLIPLEVLKRGSARTHQNMVNLVQNH
jgi:hypothetical protein